MTKFFLFTGASAVVFAAAAHAEIASSDDAKMPLETVIVIGHTPQAATLETYVEPALDGRLATLDDLFQGTPGVQLEPVFGGIDHPRFSIRGSGLQRGTQPAGRGIELRLDGIPIGYADTSFDFVEWIDPLLFDSVRVYRGGRGALEGGSTLGGIVNFETRGAKRDFEGLVRAEVGAFGFERGQVAIGGAGERLEGFATATWFAQDGFREYGAQDAVRGFGSLKYAMSAHLKAGVSFLLSDSELELPGPQTLAQIAAGSEAAQQNNINGDWRRFVDRQRIAADLDYDKDGRQFQLGAAFMATDVSFRRRDVQDEDNQDIALTARYRDAVSLQAAEFGANLIYQSNTRHQQQFFNGGGTPPSFNGARGALWADNDLEATRLTAQGVLGLSPATSVRLDLAAGWDFHTRDIKENFSVRAERPESGLAREYDGFNGLVLLSYDTPRALTLFAGASHVIEPPTYDVLMINRAGTPGPNNALLNGADPRRPAIRDLDAQTAVTLEGGLKGQVGPVHLDLTVYRSWIDNEIVSTTNAVTQNVTSVGNADKTTRFGIEAAASMQLAEAVFMTDDQIRLALDWTYIDAKFDDDPTFANNTLPIVVSDIVEGRLIYRGGAISAEAFVTHVPRGGYADYANSLRADGYTTLGANLSYAFDHVSVFVEGRNLSDTAYTSSVIGARNNLNGQDNAIFAPGEPMAFTIGARARF